MAVKNVIQPYLIANAKSLGASFTSTPTDIRYIDNVGVIGTMTGSTATGTLSYQYSMDAVNWITDKTQTITNSTPTPFSYVSTAVSMPYAYFRISYAFTSGAGTMTAYVMGKAI